MPMTDEKALEELKITMEAGQSYGTCMKDHALADRPAIRKAMSQHSLWPDKTPGYLKTYSYDYLKTQLDSGKTADMIGQELGVTGKDRKQLSTAIAAYGLTEPLPEPTVSYEDMSKILEEATGSLKSYLSFVHLHSEWNNRADKALILRVMSEKGLRFPKGNPSILQKIPYSVLRREYMEESKTPGEIARELGVRVGAVDIAIKTYNLPSPNNRGVEFRGRVRDTMVREQTATFMEKYGGNPVKASEAVKAKIRETNLRRYGATSPFTSDEAREKATRSYLARYGVSNPSKSPEIAQKIVRSLEETGVLRPSAVERTIAGILDRLHVSYSMHDRAILGNGQEIDVALPDCKIGIECSPVATHNSNVSGYQAIPLMKGMEKPRLYHEDKWRRCVDKGWRLLTLDDVMLGHKQTLERLLSTLTAGQVVDHATSESALTVSDGVDSGFLAANDFYDGRLLVGDRYSITSTMDGQTVLGFSVNQSTDGQIAYVRLVWNEFRVDEPALDVLRRFVADEYGSYRMIIDLDNKFEAASDYPDGYADRIEHVDPWKWFIDGKSGDWAIGDPSSILQAEGRGPGCSRIESQKTLEADLDHYGSRMFAMFDCGHTEMVVDL